MFFIPFPFVIAELVIFVMAVQRWGFFNTLGLYLLPCLLGLFIVTTIGRVAVLSMQTSMMKGQLPGAKLLHTAAIFLSGLLFLIPSFFTRVLGVVLSLPGLRHLAVWRFKGYLAKQMSRGAGSFTFGAGGPFGFGAGSAGFRYYEEAAQEREVREANVLDVTPLKVVHENKKKDDGEGEEPQ
jgi:UPF0716 protein FxsA